jgi:hypothetical protein
VHRAEYARNIVNRLMAEKDRLIAEFAMPGRIRSFVVDGLLPEDAAKTIFKAFPLPEQMMRRHSLRESKYFAAQLDRYDRLLEEILFAFQDANVVAAFAELTGIPGIVPTRNCTRQV